MKGEGKLSIVSDGEGVITATITGTRFPSIPYTETLTLIDNNPFEIDAKDATVGFFMGTTGTSSYIDNIVVSDVEKYDTYIIFQISNNSK